MSEISRSQLHLGTPSSTNLSKSKKWSNTTNVSSKLGQGPTICQLPPLVELGQTLVMEELIDKIQENTNQRWEITEEAIKLTMELLEQHMYNRPDSTP
jgi:hypothetical protein